MIPRQSPGYPHSPTSATQLRIGDLVPVSDPSGRWTCLQVIELKPRARASWVAALLPWRDTYEPTADDVRDLAPIHRTLTGIEVFVHGGLRAIGNTPPADAGQERFYGPAYIGKMTNVSGWKACIRLAQHYARTGTVDPRAAHENAADR
ncbi:hypothetical protein [Microbacterium marinilacus]|uniref:Uncharacterized protein n=1 Tax=Microbacterium marinilacus TaxID=415209 RepID=A0ABP7BBQ7_9MICO|nr:hypothetical protein [Microbacterium marinilacus]MBY0686999.1 hypothetical protein [Microbacterium marinilacus]